MLAKKTAGSPLFYFFFTRHLLQMDFWIRKYSDSRENYLRFKKKKCSNSLWVNFSRVWSQSKRPFERQLKSQDLKTEDFFAFFVLIFDGLFVFSLQPPHR